MRNLIVDNNDISKLEEALQFTYDLLNRTGQDGKAIYKKKKDLQILTTKETEVFNIFDNYEKWLTDFYIESNTVKDFVIKVKTEIKKESTFATQIEIEAIRNLLEQINIIKS